MYGSTPSGRSQSYSYYVTHTQVDGKTPHFACSIIDEKIPLWLQGISVDQNSIPSIREVYQAEIQQATTNDNGKRLTALRKQSTLLKEEEARLGRLYITGKITDLAYEQLHSEWQEKLRNNELTMTEMEREPTFHINDLDIALVLLTKIDKLYIRLDEKQKATLLQILQSELS